MGNASRLSLASLQRRCAENHGGYEQEGDQPLENQMRSPEPLDRCDSAAKISSLIHYATLSQRWQRLWFRWSLIFLRGNKLPNVRYLFVKIR